MFWKGCNFWLYHAQICWSSSKNTKSVIKCPMKETKTVENQINKNIIHDNSAAISVGQVDGSDVEPSPGRLYDYEIVSFVWRSLLKIYFDFLYQFLYILTFPGYCFTQVLTNFNDNTHNCQRRSPIEINIEEKTRIFSLIHHTLLPKEINMNKEQFFNAHYNRTCLHLFSIRKCSF